MLSYQQITLELASIIDFDQDIESFCDQILYADANLKAAAVVAELQLDSATVTNCFAKLND